MFYIQDIGGYMATKTIKTETKTQEPKLTPQEATIKALKKEGVTAEIWEAAQEDVLKGKSYIRLSTTGVTRLLQVETADLGNDRFIAWLLTEVKK